MIKVSHIFKKFREKVALEDVSFEVKSGEIFGFLGPSGAGKTTTIHILTGQLIPDQGIATVLGKDTNKLNPLDFGEIGIMSDTVGFYEKMTVYQNLLFFAKFHQIKTDRLDFLLKELDLFKDRNTRSDRLSTGMRQRMLLIRSILHHPKILFLDEPTSGLDPILTNKVHHILQTLKEEGCTIFLTTHNMDEATKICDTIGLLYSGHLIEYGAPQDIIDKYSPNNKVLIRFKNQDTKIISKKMVANYINSSDVISIHTLEESLENIFINLAKGEKHE